MIAIVNQGYSWTNQNMTKQELITLIKQYGCKKEIANVLNIHYNTLRLLLKKHNLIGSSIKYQIFAEMNGFKNEIEMFQTWADRKMSYREMAALLPGNLHSNSMELRCRKLGIKITRKPGGANNVKANRKALNQVLDKRSEV